jgi:hypothetical protein
LASAAGRRGAVLGLSAAMVLSGGDGSRWGGNGDKRSNGGNFEMNLTYTLVMRHDPIVDSPRPNSDSIFAIPCEIRYDPGNKRLSSQSKRKNLSANKRTVASSSKRALGLCPSDLTRIDPIDASCA